MRIVRGPKAEQVVRELEQRGAVSCARVMPMVKKIVGGVRRDGDRALRRYAEKFDGVRKGQPLVVSQDDIQASWEQVTPEFRKALKQAERNIRRFCQWQKPKEWVRQMQPGLRVGQLIRPMESVGCYVPGGRYPLPSTLLMTVIPAQVAGVPRIAVASPRPAPETLAAAALLGVKTVYRMGGAQAVAALAYGTESVERVDKIVGPGNLYVTAAKQMVAWDCSIDFLAGPTEVVLVSEDGEPCFLASDLVAQAEHDPDASAVMVTSSMALALAVQCEVGNLSEDNPTAQTSLKANGYIIVANDPAQSLEYGNRIASEHTTVPKELVGGVRHAGAVFVGDWSPQAMGDYASGPNHVLPTGAVARYRGGLSTVDFVKIISLQECTERGLHGIAPVITTLADKEGLKAHANSVRVRVAVSKEDRANKSASKTAAKPGSATASKRSPGQKSHAKKGNPNKRTAGALANA
jgi:histidinol dehydrogenase